MSRDWTPTQDVEEAFAVDGAFVLGLCILGITCEVIAIIAFIIHGL